MDIQPSHAMMRCMDQTLAYYDAHAQVFTSSTVNVEMGSIRKEFTALLPPHAHILDLGCGSGRDSLAFINEGYTVTAVDGSQAMCDATNRLTGLPVRRILFQELDYQDAFDAVWACSSLLHAPSIELPAIFRLIHSSLKEGGIFYSSFKCSSFEGIRNGRYFTDLTEASFLPLLEGLFTPLKTWRTEDVRPDRDEIWLNAIVRKE